MKKHILIFSTFEKCLWIFSVLLILIPFLFFKDKDYLTLISSIVGATALIYLAKGHILGQILTLLFGIFYAFVSYHFRYYGELCTFIFMSMPLTILNIISWYKHPFMDTNEVTICRVTKKNILIISILTFIVTIMFYYVLKYFSTPNLFFSTISISTSFFSASLSYLRSPYYAIGYMANDIVLIILWSLATLKEISYLPMVCCFIAFFMQDLYGFINWKKMQKQQTNISNLQYTSI